MWPFKKKPTEWEISSQDLRWVGLETEATLAFGWEAFDVSSVPNDLNSEFKIRLWMRRPKKYKKKASKVIRIQSAGWGGHQVLLHLTDKWEPFGTTMSSDNHIIWFKKDK